MSLGIIIVLIAYLALFMYLMVGWGRARTQEVLTSGGDDSILVSIIIPFRNEEENIPALLDSIYSQSRSMTECEFIFVNDHSEDDSQKVLESRLSKLKKHKVLSNNGQGKKRALETGIAVAVHDYIVTWDADIVLNRYWYETLSHYKSKLMEYSMIILPVLPAEPRNRFEGRVALDFLSLIGMTYATVALDHPVMANGANLMFSKNEFIQSEEAASGDDVFLLHSIKSKRGNIGYLSGENLSVQTSMPLSWKEYIQQRLRWANKNRLYRDFHTLFLGWFVLVMNLALLAFIILSFIRTDLMLLVAALIAVKMLLDWIFLHSVTSFYNKQSLMRHFIPAFLFSLVQMPVLFFLGMFKGYSWKGRSYTQ